MQVYCWICSLWHQHNKFQTLYRWCTIVSATSKCAEPQVENVAQGCSPSVTFPTEGHHIWLSSDQLRAASLIARNAVTWLWALSNDARFTTIYHGTFSRKVKMSEDWSSDIFTFGWSDSLDGVSTYSNADVVCYSATCQTGLNECNSVCQIVDRSYK